MNAVQSQLKMITDRFFSLGPRIVAGVIVLVLLGMYSINCLVSIPPGKIGIVYQKTGKQDPSGRFIVESGYKGVQREVLLPGWHFFWKTTLFLDIEKVSMTIVPKGKVGVLIAQDGRKLKEGAVLAADDEIDPETGKLIRMGEKGIRKSILEPGTYPVNTKYFKVEFHNALNVEAGSVGLLTRKIGDTAPPGDILVSYAKNFRGIIREVVEPGIQYLHPYVYNWQVVDAVVVEPGQVGVLTRKVGKPPSPGTVLVDRKGNTQGIIREVLEPGMYYINPFEFKVQTTPAVSIPDGYVGVMIAKTGKPAPGDELLVEPGYRGVQKQYLKPGLYYINPYEFDVVPVDTRKQKYEMTYQSDKGDTAFADEITFLSNDGFPISIDVTIIYEIKPKNAPYVVATLGKEIGDARTKIIRPGSRSFARLEGSMLKAVEFVTGETRKNFQEKLAKSLFEEGAKAQITIINTFVRSYTIPEDLLQPIRLKEIAEKQKQQIIEEQKREEEQAKLARQKALVEQESRRINAETTKIVAETKAQQEKAVAIIKGQQILEVANLERQAAEQEKLRQIALGEGEATRRELLIRADNLEELRLNIYREVMTQFAKEIGKQKWVPDMVIGGASPASGGRLTESVSNLIYMFQLIAARQLGLYSELPPSGPAAPSPAAETPPAKSMPPAESKRGLQQSPKTKSITVPGFVVKPPDIKTKSKTQTPRRPRFQTAD